MARRSIYEFEAKGTVSIWVATVPRSRIPADYFEEHYGRGDDDPFSRFSEDFGFGYYDHDSSETNGVTGLAKPIAELLGPCSFSTSYIAEADASAKRQSLETNEFVFLLFDIAYRPEATGVSRSESMAFLGSFRFEPDAESAVADAE
jgi:Immunity protein 22